MKKVYASLAAAILLIVCTFCSSLLFEKHIDHLLREEEPSFNQLKNPVPPDLESLRKMGIEAFTSSVPVVMIDTEGRDIVREEKHPVTVAIFDHASGENDITGSPTAVIKGKMKIRGGDGLDKRQYRLNFTKNKSGSERKYPFLGMASDSRWVLHGPFADRSLMRNYLMYTLARETMEWAPDCRFFELFIDGVYEGVYLAVEPVTVSKNRLNLAQFSLISGQSPYILYRDRIGEEEMPALTYSNQNGYIQRLLDIRYPDPKYITSAQVKWIGRDISLFEKALYNEEFQYGGISYQEYIDLQSFADYLILNEFAMNRDFGALSAYTYKDLHGKLHMCVWDFDRGFNNYRDPMNANHWIDPVNTWFERLLQDPEFIEFVIGRYHELRVSALSDEHIEKITDDAGKILSEPAERDFLRWNQAREDDPLLEKPGENRNLRDFDSAVVFLKDVIHKRLKFLDQEIEYYEKVLNLI